MARAGLLALLLAFPALAGCDRAGEPPLEEPLAGEATYVVHGRVLEPFDGERLAIRHEPIPEFVGVAGPEPMAEMSMRFPVEDESVASDLVAGDLVRFELVVDWQQRPPHRIVAIERLAEGTELKLSR